MTLSELSTEADRLESALELISVDDPQYKAAWEAYDAAYQAHMREYELLYPRD